MNWEWEIKPHGKWLGVNLKELFAYKDLLFRLVRKEFLLRYQQTILGPVWVVIQPLLTVMIYVVVFNKVIKVPIPNVPPVLFYLSGITLWTLFSDIFNATASTFSTNIEVFNKVYFPRLIAPLSISILHLLRFLIQLVLLILILLYYFFTGGIELNSINILSAIIPVVITVGFGLGGGLIFSIVTAKYRDLSNMISLFISLLMFVCPIFYSTQLVSENIRWIVNINPLSPLFEMFRYAFLGVGQFTFLNIVYSSIIMLVLLVFGLLLFNKKGDELIDVV